MYFLALSAKELSYDVVKDGENKVKSQNKEKQNKRERESALRMLCEYNSVPTHTQSQTTPLGTVLNKLQHTASDIIHTTFSLLPFCVVACSGLEIILQHIYINILFLTNNFSGYL